MTAMNNSTDSMNGIYIWYQVWAVFLSLSGIVGYLAVCWVIIRHKKTFFKNPFFTLALSMALLDVLILSFQLIYATPAAIIGEENMPDWFKLPIGFLNLWVVWTKAFHVLVICINRLTAVTLLQRYHSFFTSKNLAVILGVSYGYSLLIVVATYGCSCIFSTPDGYTWGYTCDMNSHCAWIIVLYAQVMSCLMTSLFVGVYVITIWRVRKFGLQIYDDQIRARRVKKEKALVFQFGLICLIGTLYPTMFWILYLLGDRLDPIAAQWILGTVTLLHSSLNPFLLMTNGSDIKRLLFQSGTATSCN